MTLGDAAGVVTASFAARMLRKVKLLQKTLPASRIDTDLRIHTSPPPHAPSQQRMGRAGDVHGSGPGHPRLPCRFQKPCKLHPFLWTPPDERTYVEVVCRPSQLCDFLGYLSALLGEGGPPEQVWFVLRSGLAAWLDKQEPSLGLLGEFDRLPRERCRLPAELMRLPAANQLVFREVSWDARQFNASRQRLHGMAVAISNIAERLWIQPLEGPIDFLDWLLTVRLRGESQSPLEELERTHGCLFCDSRRPTPNANKA